MFTGFGTGREMRAMPFVIVLGLLLADRIGVDRNMTQIPGHQKNH